MKILDLPPFLTDPVKLAADKLVDSVEKSAATRKRIAEYMEQHNVGKELAPGQEAA